MPLIILVLVALQRLAELMLARRNEARLLARGGVEHGRGHYRLFVILHGAWLLAILAQLDSEQAVNWLWLALFMLLQAGRAWVIASLGPFWTTRIITLDRAPLVRRGPYRWVRHPNYWVVAGEIIALPMAFGQIATAAVFTVLSGALTLWRIRTEDRVLAPRRNR
ncbi:membrane protein [Rhodospirillales bacterium TMPK1]|uniref:Membrane protein n=1 Tax=Roseiterribacter gracilis TaxID=2812848 RepID=A0A8S8X954_9PROT|nr:membrane protein [Rhodospirillales bacterium TMPK1]